MKTNAPNSEQRIESKYIIDKKHLPAFIKLFEHYLVPDYIVPVNSHIVNKSIYFDTPELKSLTDHLKGKEERQKIRIRRYAPDGHWNNDIFAEIKRKDGEETIKDRLKISLDGYSSLMNKSELPLDEELLIFNEDNMDETDIIMKTHELNHELKEGNYKPVVEINYKRIAFKKDESFRVTIDQDIKIKPLQNLKVNEITKDKLKDKLKEVEEKFLNFDDFILEIKHQDGEIPKWLQKKLDKLYLEETSFSKFCFSMARLGQNELKVSL
jgi:hypothetical protein